MGSVSELLTPVGTPESLLDDVITRLWEREARWSRFNPHSELSLLNTTGFAELSAETVELLALAVLAHERTGGLFDPSVHDALIAVGYDRSFHLINADDPVKILPTPPVHGLAGLTIGEGYAELATGLRLDLGGIGKGRAADLAAADLAAAGVPAALVSLGGDTACFGGEAAPFPLIVRHPETTAPLATLELASGAATTSSSAGRRFGPPKEARHHLIDPRTGQSCHSDLDQITCIAASAAWAEAIGKAALIAGESMGFALLAGCGLAGLGHRSDGTLVATEAWPAFATVPVLSPSVER